MKKKFCILIAWASFRNDISGFLLSLDVKEYCFYQSTKYELCDFSLCECKLCVSFTFNDAVSTSNEIVIAIFTQLIKRKICLVCGWVFHSTMSEKNHSYLGINKGNVNFFWSSTKP